MLFSITGSHGYLLDCKMKKQILLLLLLSFVTILKADITLQSTKKLESVHCAYIASPDSTQIIFTDSQFKLGEKVYPVELVNLKVNARRELVSIFKTEDKRTVITLTISNDRLSTVNVYNYDTEEDVTYYARLRNLW